MTPSAATEDPFQIIERVRDDFATAPLAEAFNWERFAAATELTDWYQVVFRSHRKVNADVTLLEQLDDVAHYDAADQPGFLFYFKGKILPGVQHRYNLSFCMWQSREHAVASARRSAHTNASRVALEMYDEYRLERYFAHVRKSDNRAWIEFEALPAKP